MHTSMPNQSSDRRIGLNIQYIAPSMRQLKDSTDSASLVRGQDLYNHFQTDIPAEKQFDRDAWIHQQQLKEKLTRIQSNTTS